MQFFATSKTTRAIIHGDQLLARIERDATSGRWLMHIEGIAPIDVSQCNHDPPALFAVLEKHQWKHAPRAELEKLFSDDAQEAA